MRLSSKYMAGAAALATAMGATMLSATEVSATTVAPVHGTVQVWVNPRNDGGGTINLTGALGDAGVAEPTNSHGQVVHGPNASNADYRLLELTKG